MKKVLAIMMTLTVLFSAFSMSAPRAKAQDQPLFKVTIIAPGNANLLRRQWAHIFADSLQQLGIDANVMYLNWTEVFDRVFTPLPENVGESYDDGGFDIQLVGWTPGLIPQPRQIFYASPESFAPLGSNYYLWNNTQSNTLLDTFITSTNATEQWLTLQEWQSLFYNEVPCSQIFYSSTPTAVTPELAGPALSGTVTGAGEGWLYFNVQPNPELLTGKASVVYASSGEIDCLIPPLSSSWFDTIIHACIHDGLVEAAPDLSDLSIPALLTDWTPSENGFKWTWTCRTGVKWHDGADFTADDVVFSLWALMNPSTGSQYVGTYQSVYGDNVKFTYENGSSTTLGTGTRVGNITAVDANTVEAWLPEFALGRPYGFFDPCFLGFANNIIPKHIYEKIAPTDWTDSPFNTGEGIIVVPGTPGMPGLAPETYNGPVGTGPYKWVDFNPVEQLIHLEKFTDYWNRTALEADGLFGVTDYYIKFIAGMTPALTALKNEEVDMLDPQYFSYLSYLLQADFPTVDPAWGKILLQEGTGRQEAGYNNRHPVFGTGVNTPLGQSDPARAAEAAKYVRIAFDYCIQRQLIVDDLLAGYGQPAATTILPTQPYYNSSITPRRYNLWKAKEYLEKAGYTVLLRLRTETSINVGGNDYPVTIVSNTTIEQTVATSNTLHFESSGPTGEKGYINVTFPMVNTTAIKVFVDGVQLTPPQFPTITSNGTHYFIYFEFTLSTHAITIQFAPSAPPPPPVGGKATLINVPINKPELQLPWLLLSTIILAVAASVAYIKYRKKQ